ncbi:hypothetical protein P4M26_04340 [Pseudomonas aeruginosa]|nr:hypothetical protein [Pseudomonas aeruginosa]
MFLERRQVQRVLLPFVALQRLAEASNTLGVRPGALRVVVSSGEQLRITETSARSARRCPGYCWRTSTVPPRRTRSPTTR